VAGSSLAQIVTAAEQGAAYVVAGPLFMASKSGHEPLGEHPDETEQRCRSENAKGYQRAKQGGGGKREAKSESETQNRSRNEEDKHIESRIEC